MQENPCAALPAAAAPLRPPQRQPGSADADRPGRRRQPPGRVPQMCPQPRQIGASPDEGRSGNPELRPLGRRRQHRPARRRPRRRGRSGRHRARPPPGRWVPGATGTAARSSQAFACPTDRSAIPRRVADSRVESAGSSTAAPSGPAARVGSPVERSLIVGRASSWTSLCNARPHPIAPDWPFPHVCGDPAPFANRGSDLFDVPCHA